MADDTAFAAPQNLPEAAEAEPNEADSTAAEPLDGELTEAEPPEAEPIEAPAIDPASIQASVPAVEPSTPPEPAVVASGGADQGVTEVAPAQPQPDAVVAATLEVPALGTSSSALPADGGGEWHLLTSQVRAWLDSGELQRIWSQVRTPLTATAALIGLIVVLRIYAALLGAIDSLPLVPGLLELVGVIWLARRGLPKLVRTSERQQLIDALSQRWQAFRGQR